MQTFVTALEWVPAPLTQCAALAVELARDAPERIGIIPDGEFNAVDGRPGNMQGVKAKTWRMDAAIAEGVIAQFTRGGIDIPVDYEHQTIKAADNGRPAPAAGWITGLEYQPGVGLVARVRWTDAAATHLTNGEYRYLSPVFFFDPASGAVLSLHSVALTNTPALGALGEIAALVRQRVLLRRLPGCGRITDEEPTMDRTKVLVALGLPPDTGDEAALASLTALAQQAREQEAQIAELKARAFDPAKHIPLTEHTKLAAELAELKHAMEAAEHGRLMQAALDDARILPPNEAYWRAQPLAVLQAFLKDAKPLVALQGTQTGGKMPAGDGVSLSADELTMCKCLGLTPEQFTAAKGE